MISIFDFIHEKLYHKQVDEKLVFNKHTKAKINYSIEKLSDKYNFDLIDSEYRTWYGGKKYNNKEFKVSNDLFKTNITNKILELNDEEIKSFADNLNNHFKDILNDKYSIALGNFKGFADNWCIIRLDIDDDMCAEALYSDTKKTITFKILKDETEAEIEKILSNVIEYIINN